MMAYSCSFSYSGVGEWEDCRWEASINKISQQDSIIKLTKAKNAESMVQAIECMQRKHKAPNSQPSIDKIINK
jgi:hypothetical protein